MKQVFIEKAAGAFLILSELIVIIPKILSVPEALESASSWAAPDDGTLWFIGLFSSGNYLAVSPVCFGVESSASKAT